MRQFELNQNVLDGPGARRIIKMYNKLARTLVAFEYLWHQAWVQSIDQAKSGLQATLIIRHPEDPLVPGRQIWTYYTHLADSAGDSYIIDQIPPGTVELPVKQGTLLGYQGDYNGGSLRQIDTHLHFSIVLDDGSGNFRNETDLANTLDPSPYLGMRLNTTCADRPPVCRPDYFCP